MKCAACGSGDVAEFPLMEPLPVGAPNTARSLRLEAFVSHCRQCGNQWETAVNR